MPEVNTSIDKIQELTDDAIILLKNIIQVPSLSKEERHVAMLITHFLESKGIEVFQKGYNLWAITQNHSENAPTILLNSHHDTVKPSLGWDTDPFKPIEKEGKIIGLGSNDAGASVVSLLATFLYLNSLPSLPYKLIVAITAEEEISGQNGIASILEDLGKIDLGIVGEPTGMNMAIAEKGLMVLDCTVYGRTGHAARNEGENAIYKAMTDIEWFRNYKFEKESPVLGPIKMTVTQINAGTQHNVVPDLCSFVVDVRTTECYTNAEIVEIIQGKVGAEVKPRSTRLNASGIALDHPIVQKGLKMGMEYYGSPTLSDQALMPFTTIKIGPGQSARSHTPNEYIMIDEVREGIIKYIELLKGLEI
jgi:acetylornithine deacetylase